MPKGLSSTHPVTFHVIAQKITSAKFAVTVPDSVITFDPAATRASTVFTSGQWVTRAPSSGLAANTFLSSVGYPVPANLPGGMNPVTWSGSFVCDTRGVTMQWKWAASVYTAFSSDPNALGVKPCDDNKASIYQNSDHAGTPENYRAAVTGGACGGGGANFTGGYSGTGWISPCNGQ